MDGNTIGEKLSVFVVGSVLIGAVAFVVGIVIGVQLGEMNLHIDFCADDTSPRFIVDDASRDASCH